MQSLSIEWNIIIIIIVTCWMVHRDQTFAWLEPPRMRHHLPHDSRRSLLHLRSPWSREYQCQSWAWLEVELLALDLKGNIDR
jgi:uncharacterized protein involved in cysteine biosynthesis